LKKERENLKNSFGITELTYVLSIAAMLKMRSVVYFIAVVAGIIEVAEYSICVSKIKL
jgi:hypothetical protein